MTGVAELLQAAAAASRAGQLGQAEQLYRQVLDLDLHHAEALAQLGVIAYQAGRPALAADYLRQLADASPADPVRRSNLGVALAGQGRLDEAEAEYRAALRLRPNFPEAHNNLGNVLRKQGRLAEAEAAYRVALELRPGYPEAHNNLGSALSDQGRLAEAEAAFGEALTLRPAFAEANNNLGNARVGQGRLADAEAAFREALRLRPDFVAAHNGLAMLLLSQERFHEGWAEYEWRLRSAPPSDLGGPAWDGSPLPSGTLLLRAEQGLGDTLQFVRYAACVKERVGTAVLECPLGLVPLLSRCVGIGQVIAQGSPPPFDAHAALGSLPHLLGLTDIRPALPYLAADPELARSWHDELASMPGFKVGIAWQGNPAMGAYDRRRSFPLTALEPLTRLAGVRLIVLQKGHGREQLTAVSGWPLTDFGERLDSTAGAFMDTAAVMSHLDLVVTCDSSLAHLAGALGVPAWVALPFAADWRWLVGRDDSPWYPSLRLFRQTQPGDWAGVFERVAEALRERAGGVQR